MRSLRSPVVLPLVMALALISPPLTSTQVVEANSYWGALPSTGIFDRIAKLMAKRPSGSTSTAIATATATQTATVTVTATVGATAATPRSQTAQSSSSGAPVAGPPQYVSAPIYDTRFQVPGFSIASEANPAASDDGGTAAPVLHFGAPSRDALTAAQYAEIAAAGHWQTMMQESDLDLTGTPAFAAAPRVSPRILAGSSGDEDDHDDEFQFQEEEWAAPTPTVSFDEDPRKETAVIVDCDHGGANCPLLQIDQAAEAIEEALFALEELICANGLGDRDPKQFAVTDVVWSQEF